ncbi:MAG: DUF4105 domain-containing protein [Proteobacteria bacterium]|nr:DUF4105 domain-containing protein [Pseudomonadota bacterium]
MLYALYGAIGGFRGTFSKMPYYYKVREYSDFESRDLWSYDLNLSPAEIEELVNHIWELGSAEFDYYFFSRNCSYQILAALDVLRPEWNFTEAMGTIVFPSETIKLLAARPGLIKAVEYRPSKRKIFEEHIPALSVGERRLFDRILASRKPEFPEDIPVEVRRKVLDALIDYHDFRYGKEILTGNGPRSEERQGFLVARSVLGLKSTELPIRPPLEKQPQLGHDPHRLSFTAGHSTFQGDFLGLNLRGGFHDLLDPPDGYPDHSQIELLDAGVRIVSASAKIRLDHLLLVNNASLTPLRPYSSPLSWRLRIGMERLSESGCPDCLAGRFQLGGGVTVEAIQDHLYFYFLPQIGADWAPGFEGTKLRPGLGVLGGTRIQIYRNLAGTLDGTAFRGILSARTELRLAPSSDSAIGLTGSASAFNTEAGASLYLYF